MIKTSAVTALLFVTLLAGTALGAPPGQFTLTDGRRVCSNAMPWLTFTWTAAAGATSYSILRNGVTVVASTTAQSYEDANVTSGTNYTYSVIAGNADGTTPSVNTLTMMAPYCTPPEAPVLSATTICQDARPLVRLTWNATARTESYEIYKNGIRYRANLPASTTSFIDTSVTVGTTYSYLVRAMNVGTGAPTPPPSTPGDSNTVTLTVDNPCPPPPAAPTVSATSSCQGTAPATFVKVTVTWTTSAGATSYSLYRNDQFLASNLTATRYEDTNNVVPGNTYTYHVYAYGEGGQSAPGSTTVMVPAGICAPPGTPVVQASNVCTQSGNPAVQLTWSAVSNATSYTVLRNGAAVASGLTGTQYQDTPTVGVTYSYVVRAVNANATTDSAPVSITHTDVCPRAPGAFTSSVSVICSNAAPAVRVTWTAASGAATYSVVRNGATIASGLTGTSYDDRTVIDGATYSYLVRAVNNTGSTDSNPNSVTVADPCPRPPGPLTLSGRSFCSGTTAAVSLSWTAAERAVSYTILRNGTTVVTGISGTSYQDTDVVPGNAYTYVVRALNANGGSDSNPFSVTPANCNTNTPRADLAVSNVELSRASATAGDRIEVSYSVTNNGPAAAGETLTRIRIGTSQQPSSADAVVFTTAVPPLAAGATRRESHAVVIPPRLRGGTYFVYVSVNDDRAIDESTFANNAASARLEIAQPQCQLSCLVNVPARALPGQPVMFSLVERSTCEVAVTWQFGNGTTGSGEAATVTYDRPGIYSWTVVVTATGTGSTSCANAGTIEITAPPPTTRRRSVRH